MFTNKSRLTNCNRIYGYTKYIEKILLIFIYTHKLCGTYQPQSAAECSLLQQRKRAGNDAVSLACDCTPRGCDPCPCTCSPDRIKPPYCQGAPRESSYSSNCCSSV